MARRRKAKSKGRSAASRAAYKAWDTMRRKRGPNVGHRMALKAWATMRREGRVGKKKAPKRRRRRRAHRLADVGVVEEFPL